MPAPITLWLEVSHHAAFRIGGWAYVRRDGAAVTGHAGGARRIDAERAALSALLAALEPPGEGPVQIHTGSRLVAQIPERIRAAEAGEAPPTDNLDLWAQAIRAPPSEPFNFCIRSSDAPAARKSAAWVTCRRISPSIR